MVVPKQELSHSKEMFDPGATPLPKKSTFNLKVTDCGPSVPAQTIYNTVTYHTTPNTYTNNHMSLRHTPRTHIPTDIHHIHKDMHTTYTYIDIHTTHIRHTQRHTDHIHHTHHTQKPLPTYIVHTTQTHILHIHTYIHTYIHTHIHTHIHTPYIHTPHIPYTTYAHRHTSQTHIYTTYTVTHRSHTPYP